MFLWISMNFFSLLIRGSQMTRNFNVSTGNEFIMVVNIFERLNNGKN